MNILYVAHRIPYPPNKGEKVRAFHQISYLSRQHLLHLACLIDEPEDLQYTRTLETYCASVDAVYRDKAVSRLLAVPGLFSDRPLSVACFYSTELRKKIAQRIRSEKIDRILVFSSAVAEYVRGVAGVPKVIDFVDVDSEKWRLYAKYHPSLLSWIYRMEAKRLARYEEEIARVFGYSVFASEKEVALFRQRVNGVPVAFIPNGVDLNYFAPDVGEALWSGPPSVVFTGSMDYFPNADAVRYFCGEIFPLIRKAVPEARFYIVGRNPTRRVRELGRQVNVIVTGAVPDIRPYLDKARVAVAPLRIARGVQNKILEAMAMGLPVVGTSQAFQGVQATAAEGIRIADEPQGFAREVIAFLEDRELRRECSVQARQYVRRNHRWEDHGARLESLLKKVG